MAGRRFTKEEYEEARLVSLVDFMSSQGFSFIKAGAYLKCKEHDSLVVKPNGSWFWNSKGIHGKNAIDYLMKVEQMSFIQAMKALSNGDIIKTDRQAAEDKPPFILPSKADNYRRAFAYLNKTRGIDAEIIARLMEEHKIYETQDYHNCACVGFDEKGEARHVAMWGTYTPKGKKRFKGEGVSSDKNYGFHMQGKSKTVYVYESPIDAMSHATMIKMRGEDDEMDYRISLCCTWDGALERFLKHHDIKRIVFCLDNDRAGNEASEKYLSKYNELGYETERLKPQANDMNEDLLNILERSKESEGLDFETDW